MTFRYGSVCSGIEAASAAWEPLGWNASFFSEIEPFPRAVLKHRFPAVPLHGDFTTIESNQYDPIDILVGGTPCQSFSVAGLRGGLADERGNLALEYLRLAQRTRPRWLVWENVPGVLSSNEGRDFGSILGGMVQLGYGIAYRVLDAQYFGVAQRRRRVFVVGYLGDWRRAAAVLFERHSLSGHPAPRREAGQNPAPTISARPTGGGGLGTDFDCDGGLIARCVTTGEGRRQDYETTTLIGVDPLPAMTTRTGTGRDGMDDYCVAHSLRGEGFDASEDGSGRGTPLVPVAFAQNTRNEMRATPINTQMATRGPKTSNTPREGIGVGNPGDPAFTLQAAHHHAVQIATAVRRLTPRECERLQGFPDDWTAIPWRGKPAAECPDGPRYKALGNSMAVPVMRWIGERIAQVEALT